eukprot:11703959-Karenia_brevis.AAC.1
MTRMTAEMRSVENEMSRVEGFLPVQWIIDRQLRRGAEISDDGPLSYLEEKVNPMTIFAECVALRQEARKVSMELNSSRRAIL